MFFYTRTFVESIWKDEYLSPSWELFLLLHLHLAVNLEMHCSCPRGLPPKKGSLRIVGVNRDAENVSTFQGKNRSPHRNIRMHRGESSYVCELSSAHTAHR